MNETFLVALTSCTHRYEWKEGKVTVWDIEQSIHEYHDKIARSLYRSYAMTDTFLAVAFGVAQGVLSLDDIPESEKAKIQDVAEGILLFENKLY